MGSVGKSGNMTFDTYKYEQPILDLSGRNVRPSKKSDDIFNSTYFELKRAMDAMGYDDNSALPRLSTDGLMSTRTYKDIQARILSRQRLIDTDVKLGIYSKEQGLKEKQILNAMQRTLNNTVKREKAFNDWIKGRITDEEYQNS